MLPRKTETLAILIAGLIGGVGYAHPPLKTAEPGQGGTGSSPRGIPLTFTQDLVAKISGFTIKGHTRALIETASPSADPNNKRQLVVPIPKPLPPGTYDVDWHAVSVDTHRVTGQFSFKVTQ